MRRALALVMVGLLIGGCGGDEPVSSSTSPTPAPTELEAFCERWTEVRDMGRREMMRELVEVAPTGYRDLIESETDRGGGPDNAILVDELLDECERRMDG